MWLCRDCCNRVVKVRSVLSQKKKRGNEKFQWATRQAGLLRVVGCRCFSWWRLRGVERR